jgi:pimeloyl-ACP methyl ester carboxylesterase
VSSLPLRARRAVLSGASSARHRAASLDVHGLRTAVRRRASDADTGTLRSVAGRRRRRSGAAVTALPLQDGGDTDVTELPLQDGGDTDVPIHVDALVAAALPEARTSGSALSSGSRTVDLDGPVHYVDHGGDGPPLVAVHGLGGSHANWHDLGPLLARHSHVYALDLAGHGRTPREGRSSSVRANRELLDRFLEEVVGEPAVLLGNSMGGTIAMLEAAEHPDRVLDLVVIGPAAPRVRSEVPELALARQAALFAVPGVAEKVLARRLDKLGAEEYVRAQMTLTTADINRVSREMRQVAVELVASRAAGPDTEAAFLEAARSLVGLLARGSRYREMVAGIRGRALVVHGELDRLVPLSCSQALLRQRPDWRLEVLEGVGHVPQIEVPERTAELVHGWLTRRPAPIASGDADRAAGGAA